MPFTEDEKRRWHEEKRMRETEPPQWRPEPVAICSHCQNPLASMTAPSPPRLQSAMFAMVTERSAFDP
jgi:hypothetical protein